MTLSRTGSGRAQAAPSGGRERQRRRTRKAILEAAMGLLAAGQAPTIAEVAELADVSRRTVYLYFKSQEHLLLDATLGMLASDAAEGVLAAGAEAGDSAEERMAALARATTELAPETERAGRTLIRLTVDAGAGPDEPGTPRRGYRRIEWIERALEPIRPELDPAAFERLVSALALVCGFEAVVVQRDVRGLSPAQGAEVSEWAARALIRAALTEAAAGRTPTSS